MGVPDAVQRQLVRWAAEALDGMPADQVPAALRPVARFRANRRAQLGAGPLSAALDSDSGFRAAVAEHARSAGAKPEGDADPVERAAAAFLFQHPSADQLGSLVAEQDELTRLRAENRRLARDLDSVRSSTAPSPAPAPVAPDGPAPDGATADSRAAVERLKQRLREQGIQLRAARDEAAGAQERATAELRALRIQHDRAVTELKNTQDRLAAESGRAERALQQVAYLQGADRTAREAADRRIDLLLSTVEQASQALRREWKLATGGPDPADVVAGTLSGPQARGGGDVASLAGWLGMPQAHLLVDGYNVTKQSYPQLTLAEQRDRLLRELAGLAARSGAEVTVVFDGAAVVAPQARVRGVRVLYSPAGVTADEVLVRLVAAEPQGRVLLVVTADREIVTRVTRAGARPVAPPELLVALASER